MKEKLKNLLKNPIGICLAVIHWLIVVNFFVFFDGSNSTIAGVSRIAASFLFFLDILAILPAFLLGYLVASSSELADFWTIVFSFLTVTFQWLLIGRIISKCFWQKDEEITALNISDE
jgi:hypothetical protein